MQNDLIKIDQLCLQNNFIQAEKIARKLLDQHPHQFICYKALGVTLTAQKKINEALQILLHANSIESNDFDVNNNLSFLYLEIQNIEQSMHYGEIAITISASRPEPYLNLARCLMIQRDFVTAEKNVLKSIELRGGKLQAASDGFGDLFETLLDSLIAQNKLEECTDLCVEILDEVHLFICLTTLMDLDFSRVKDIYIQRIRDYLISSPNKSNVSDYLQLKAFCHFSMAKFNSKIKDKIKSEEHYIKANGFVLEWQRFMPLYRQKFFQKTIDFFSTEVERLKNMNIPKNKGQDLIFILGMPRSGTTLTESILATNSNLFAGGEMLFFENELKDKENYREINSKNLDSDFFRKLGDMYLEQSNFLKKDKKYFTDKLPDNYSYLGYIKIALPGAKFIHISRDPWDNAISIFKQIYLSNLLYSSSFFNIGLEYANHLAMMEFWRNFFGADICLDIKYEQIVQNYENLSKQIWEFCEFDAPADLNSRANFYARTASKTQVRGEVHQKSIKKVEFEEKKEIFDEALNNQRDYWQKKYQLF